MGLGRGYGERGGRSFAQHVIIYKLISFGSYHSTRGSISIIPILQVRRWKSIRSKAWDSNPGHSSSMHDTTLPLRGHGTHIQQQPWKMFQTKRAGQPTKLIKILHAKQSDKWTDKGQAVWPANDREANKSKIKFGIFFKTFTQQFHNNKIRHFPEGPLQSSYINYSEDP